MKKFMMGMLGIIFALSLQATAGPGDHFPWGSEMPFPWRGIQGTWSTQIGETEALVSFKIVKTDEGSRQLRISIIDAESCKVVAIGAGYEDGRIVKAFMSGGGRASRVTVHAFREADLRAAEGRKEYKANAMVAVMSVTPISGGEKVGYELVKVSNETKATCR